MDQLRETFDQAAERYDRERPAYPPALVTELARLARLDPGSRVLEIGPGTGQLTVALAEYGCEIRAVELGANLTAIARRNLAGFPRVEVVTSSFEAWQPPPEPFDLVVAATAFHWLDPAIRVPRSADVLRAGGRLATIATHHVAGGSAGFFADVQDCYERWDPATVPGERLPRADAIGFDSTELDESGRFAPATFHRHERDITYTTGEYLETLLTYSGHLAMEPRARDGLLRCIAALADERYGGTVVKRYLHELRIATVTAP